MKKFWLLTTAILCLFQESLSQSCLPEGITFQSQAEIDNFHTNYPGCTQIEGFLNVYGGQNTITNLNGLSGITSIGDYLSVYDTDITSLNGLNSLVNIGGNLEISECNSITNLTGLGALTNVGGNVVIEHNNNLLNLSGLNSLENIGNLLSVSNNNSLMGIAGLANLNMVSGDINISANPVLMSLQGLEGLNSLPGGLFITNNAHLLTLSALSGKTSVGGNLHIYQNSLLTDFTGLESLTTIGGSFQASINPLISNFNPLSALISIGGYLAINSNASLISLEGLSSLTQIGGDLMVDQNFQLTSLSGLDHIDHHSIVNLTLENNFSLSECDIESICEYLAANPANPWIYIFGNASGCASREEIEDACAVGVEDYINNKGIVVFPNPVRETMLVEIKTDRKIEEVLVRNQVGQCLMISQPVTSFIDISMLPAGIYVLEIRSGTHWAQRKLVKMR
jgi:hypothetical protein